MKLTFKNSSIISIKDGIVTIKTPTSTNTYSNASVISVDNGTIILETEREFKKGESMYFITGNGKIIHYLYDDSDNILKKYVAINNCFKTEEEAYVKLQKFLEVLQK